MVHGLASAVPGADWSGSVRWEEARRSALVADPAPIDAVSCADPAAPVEQPERAAAMLIVVVDDDPLVLEGTGSMLQDLGHKVLSASSGHQAWEMILREPEVSLLITDQMIARHERLRTRRAARFYAALDSGHPRDRIRRIAGRSRSTGHQGCRNPNDQIQLADAIRRVRRVSAMSESRHPA